MTLDIDELVRLSQSGEALIASEQEGCTLFEVHQDRGLRWLYVGDNSLLSLMRLDAPDQLLLDYQLAMVSVLIFRLAPARVLDLGLGGGALARFFHRRLPDTELLSVERSAAMVALASRYFSLPEECAVETCSVENYLSGSPQPCELVLCDLFEGENHSQLVEQEGFYRALGDRLTEGGTLAINLLPLDVAHLLRVLMPLRASFPYVALIDVPRCGNIVLLAAREPLLVDVDAEQRIARLSTELAMDIARPLEWLQHLPVPGAV
ncbi:methyltransferase domain-containing protein [Aestuariirhabdus sp. LZHN29]|uniref:methyltransferase domain-containing protein n=1 Tax=Aestuariirhabdus sp. LZHN29 TaxID=3417462 RepID=UPI003CEBD9CA